MAENLLATKAWYPEDSEIKNYAYVNTLQNDSINGIIEYQKAKNLLAQSQSLFRTVQKQRGLSAIKQLAEKEYQKEKNYLLKLGLTVEDNSDIWTQLVKGFNAKMNFQKVYQRNVSKIKQYAETGKGSGVGDITKFFDTYLYKVLYKKIENEGLTSFSDQQIQESVKEALLYMYQSAEQNPNEEAGPYLEVYQALQDLEMSSPIFQTIINDLNIEDLKNYADKIIERQKQGKKSSVRIKSHQGKTGNLFESIENLTLNYLQDTLGGDTTHTGRSLMKADNVLISKTIEVEDGILSERFETKNQSIRLKNITRLEKFYETLIGQEGDIVYISDKNYDLSAKSFADNQGFSAQTANLINLEKVLQKAEESNIKDLIFILANSGNQMINGTDYKDISDYLATKIAYFLFDDVLISQEILNNTPNINSIHLFNLGGVYIPLSVFLNCAAKALSNFNTNEYSKYVSVSINTPNTPNTALYGNLQPNDWMKFRLDREKNTTVAFHFFGDFINFVKEYL